ncbi:probable gluconokinase isoform X3 [Chiroxiphia lanceolata]|uniref:probable gluconokinase isoform X3 n=1 Tax=Chiroxiphia lanceolata TaxID=296741 RepID=UPI0013CEB751|nr:probable gluconokinase isoform X3 [Chiroxiphia lanceolata]
MAEITVSIKFACVAGAANGEYHAGDRWERNARPEREALNKEGPGDDPVTSLQGPRWAPAWQRRIPWLCKLHNILRREDSSRQDAILACSALKKMYRHILVNGASAIETEQPEEKPSLKILFVHLDGPIDIIAGRLEKRRGHFMPPELLKSQFDTLEPPSAPENFITVSLEKPLPEIVLEIESAILQGEALVE